MKAVDRYARQIIRLFNSSRHTWGIRDSPYDHRDFFLAYLSGDVEVMVSRLPSEIAGKAAKARVVPFGSESEDHARLKLAALLWMEAEGASDARAEVRGINGIADAYSERANWIVECGNTPFGKVAQSALWEEAPRFTLIPFQPLLRWDEATPRRLFALDFGWEPSLTDRLADAQFERMQKAFRHLELDALPAPPALNGRG